MLPLRDTQEQFVNAVLGDGNADALVVADWLEPQQRIAIYRHHYQASLREALALTFPVVTRLVGGNFFNGMAGAFTASNPPVRPCLAEYGGPFVDFIAAFEPARPLPYLANVALFEWLIAEAAHTPDYEGKAFYSRYPIGRIWSANQPGNDSTVDLNEGGGWFAVEKADGVVSWRLHNLPSDAFAEPQELSP